MALGTILGVASSVIGGIGKMGAANAQAKGQKAMIKAQNAANKASVENTNKYNKEMFEFHKGFITDKRKFNFDTAMINWQYKQDIQDHEYDAQLRAYDRDQENLAMQLGMNDIAAKQGYLNEQRVMRETAQQQTFARQDAYIESIQTEGRARLGSAGQSTDRAIYMNAQEHARNLAVLDASFTSAVEQHNINMFDIALAKFGADYNVRANQMLYPEALPDIPQPTESPLPNFKEPEELKHYKLKAPSGGGLGGILGGIGGILGSLPAGGLGALAGGTPSGIPGGFGGDAGGFTSPDVLTGGIDFSGAF